MPDFRSSDRPFPSTVRPGLRLFIGILLHRPSDHYSRKLRHHTNKMQEDLHHLPVHTYMGSFGHLRVRARWLVLDHHLELLGPPLRSHDICPVHCRPLTSGTKREHIRTGRGKIQKRAFQTHFRPTESTCAGLNMYPVLVSRTARQVTMGTRWTTRTTVG